MEGNTPLYAGFMSKYIEDPLPPQRICYMDPLPRSLTNNDVVRETMICTLNVANETGQDYGIVTYDLQVALKAYSIQAIETPLFNQFDKLLVMLGHFHVELAFYGAVGTFIVIAESSLFLLKASFTTDTRESMNYLPTSWNRSCTNASPLKRLK